jgi:class 3 adenylate cyclase
VSTKPPPAQVSAEIRVTPSQSDSSTIIDGERKTVTALFADIKGSTELMADLDAKEADPPYRSCGDIDDET